MSTLDFTPIQQSFADNQSPFYFVSATNFNLIDMHNWVNNWTDITFIDCFEGEQEHVLVPTEYAHPVFDELEQINQYLLSHPEVKDKIESQAKIAGKKHPGHALFLFFNNYLEASCQDYKLQLDLPPNDLVQEIDNKITTTEIGNQAKVPSVPNCLEKVDSYACLLGLADKFNLGSKWVVQSAYGDSGKTTYFINNEADYDAVADKIEAEDKVKVMKYINCVGTAIEACATKTGTFVGPLLGELIGFEELTPYAGGWCGNELYQKNFSDEVRADIHAKTERLGNTLYQRGYRGYFEVDYLIDLDDNDLYLGEINPRITGISAMTNLSPFCQDTIPLFLFHLMEYSGQQPHFSANDYNKLSLEKGATGTTSQLIMKYTDSELNIVTEAPVSGVYELDENGQLSLIKASANPTDKTDNPNYAYLLRIMKTDDYAYKGGDLGILFLNSQITQAQGKALNPNAKQWISAVKEAYITRSLTTEEEALVESYTRPTKGHE